MAISMISKILTASLCLASAFQDEAARDASPVCDVASGSCERESFMQLRAATEMKEVLSNSPLPGPKPDIPECRDTEDPPTAGDICGGPGYPTCGWGAILCSGGNVVWTNKATCSDPDSLELKGTYNVVINDDRTAVPVFQHPGLPVCTYEEKCPAVKPSGSCGKYKPDLECEYEHSCCAGAVISSASTCTGGEWQGRAAPLCAPAIFAADAIKTGDNTFECDCIDTFHSDTAVDADLFPNEDGDCDVSETKTCKFSKYCCSGEEKFEREFKCENNKWKDQMTGTRFEEAAGTCESSNIAGDPTNPPTTGQFIGQCPSGECPHRSLDIRVGDACFVVNLVHNIEPDVTRHVWMHNTAGFCDFDEHCCNGLHLFFQTFYCHDPDGNGGQWVRAHGQTGSSAPTLHEDSSDVSVNFVEKTSDIVTADGTFQKEIVNNAQGDAARAVDAADRVHDTGDKCPFTDKDGKDVFPKPLNDRNHCSCPEDPEAADALGDDCDVVLPKDVDGTNNHHVGIAPVLHDHSFEARTCTWGRLLCCKDDAGTLDTEPKKEDEGTCSPLTGDQGSPCDDHHGHAQICTGTWTNRIDRTPLVDSGQCVVTEDHTEECIPITKEPDYECPTDGEYPEVDTACEGIPNGKCEYDPICCNGEKKWSRIFECRANNLWSELGQSIDDVQNENTDSPVDPSKLVCGFSANDKFTAFDEEKGCPGVCPERREPRVGTPCWIEPFAHNLDPLITRHDVHPQFDDVHRKVRNGHCDYDEKCCGGHHIWLKTFWCDSETNKWALRERLLPHQDSSSENFNKCPDGKPPQPLGRRNHCSCPLTFAETDGGDECDAVLDPATEANLDAHHLNGRTCTWGEVCCENAVKPVPEFERICEPHALPADKTHADCVNNWIVDSTCTAKWQDDSIDRSHCGAVKFIPGTEQCYVES